MTFFFPTPTPIFPVLPVGYSVKIKPTFSTSVAISVSGLEIRSARQVWPLWEFELTFEVLRDRTQNVIQDPRLSSYTEFQQLCGLFLACRGQYGRFFYSCPEDNSRSSTILGTADGTTSNWGVTRFWGSQLVPEQVWLDQTKPYTVFLNGSDDTVNWTVTDLGRTITRSSPPGAGVVITLSFFFFYLCRFLDDIQDFDQFYHHFWQMKALKFRSVKQ